MLIAKNRLTILFCLVLMAWSAYSAQDKLYTARGVIKGTVVSADEKAVTIEVPGRGRMSYPRSIVKKLEVNPPPSVIEGIKAFDRGKMKSAKLNLSRVMENFKGMDTEWARIGLINYARACLAENDLDQAEGAFNAFLQAYPDSELRDVAKIGIADVLRKRRQYKEALKIYTEISEQFSEKLKVKSEMMPVAARTFLGIGKCMEGNNEFQDAMEAYVQIIALYPAKDFYPEALYNTAKMFIKENAPERAEKYLSELINFYPGSEFAQEALGLRKSISR
jgi:TolA-binding protein